MARQARILSKTGLYHIMFRGINKQNIFSSERDYEKLKEIIQAVKDTYELQIYAYCMMPNHVHLFLREANPGAVSDFMKRILSHYAGWYNFKYERTGHLFANRYKSIPVEDDSYFLTLAKYIHRNPFKAGIVNELSQYRHSSYLDYVQYNDDFVDIGFLLNMFDENKDEAIRQFVDFSNKTETDDYDFENSIRIRDAFERVKIVKISGGIMPHEIRNLPKVKRNEIIKKLLVEGNIKKTTLERLTGIHRNSLYRIEKMVQNGDCPQNAPKINT